MKAKMSGIWPRAEAKADPAKIEELSDHRRVGYLAELCLVRVKKKRVLRRESSMAKRTESTRQSLLL